MNTIIRATERSSRYRQFGLATFLLLIAAASSFAVFSSLDVKPSLGLPRTKSPAPRVGDTSADRDVQQQDFEQTSQSTATASNAPPRLMAEQVSYDFGQMDPHAIGQHTFQVRNEGAGPLRLLDHRSTCKCTIGQFSREPIPPGGTTEIVVQWQTQSNTSRFEQSTTVETNDPESPSLTFTITGEVRVQVGANPPEFSLPSVRPDTRETSTTIVSSQVWAGFSLRNIRSSLEGLDWDVEPASDDEREALHATAAQRLTITLPDSLPQGHFTHWIRFELVPDDPAAEPREYELPLRGKVLRRLAVYGPGIDAEGNVRLGVIPSHQGLKRRLMLKVYDQQTTLPVEQVTVVPDFVSVTVTPYSDESQDNGLYVMDIEVPPSSPPCSRQGSAAGELSIQFGHPRIPELKLRLHLAVARRLADAG